MGNRFFVAYTEHLGRLDRMLVVAGDEFFYGRNRPKDLPAAPSFDSPMAGASRAQMVEYLDFKVLSLPPGDIWTVPTNTLEPADLKMLFPAR